MFQKHFCIKSWMATSIEDIFFLVLFYFFNVRIQDLLLIQCLGRWNLQIVSSLYIAHIDICFVQEKNIL
jgi:cadmium resistance protein CadD (predicted permease)